MILNELNEIKNDKKALREFGLVMSLCFALIALVLYRKGHEVFIVLEVVSFVFLIWGLAHPASLKYPHRGWMFLALCMGWVVTRILLSILFFLVLTPIALLLRVMGKRFMDLRPRDEIKSYWNDRSGELVSNESLTRQY